MEAHEFIAGRDTWGSGGRMLDVVTLKDGRILMIADEAIVVYETRSDFEAGTAGKVLSRTAQEVPLASPASREPRLRAVCSVER